MEIRRQSRARTHGDDGSRTEVCDIRLAAAFIYFLLKDRDPSSSSHGDIDKEWSTSSIIISFNILIRVSF